MIGADDPVIPMATPISGFTGSDQSFQTAWGWFVDCVKNHRPVCFSNISLGPPVLPLRVIDVSIQSSQSVRLVETDNEKAHYACLSHCWGTQQLLRTTLRPDTLSLHKQAIEWESLPKTFQEAIEVTRRFDIQYLWIDSLCIIQDDEKDWEIQSAQMADIYRKSVITLAASASSGSQEGLFRKAGFEYIDHTLSSTDVPEGLIKIRKRKSLPHNLEDHPLLDRKWVFQERLLSTRYLHFGKNELIWECMQQLTCECGGIGFDYRRRSTWLNPKFEFHPTTLEFLNSVPRGIASRWETSVVDYSRMKCTFPNDIFPALAGVARAVGEITKWEYVAGLWKENLITDLVWRVSSPSQARRCEEWRAPTFSWASIEPKSTGCSISYDLMIIIGKGLEDHKPRAYKTELYASVVETNCVPLGGDPMGRLLSGFIKLSGTLVRATLCLKRFGDIALAGGEPLENSSFRPDYDLHQGSNQMSDGDTVYCLKLLGITLFRGTIRKESLVYLVLRKVTHESVLAVGVEEFQRIGVLKDARGLDGVPLEKVSKSSDIQHDMIVKIV